MNAREAPSIRVDNDVLYSAGTGSGAGEVFFSLIDGETLAFGPLGPLERILAIRHGEEDNLLQNDLMMDLIDEANGEGIFWGVLDSANAGLAIAQLVPEAAKFPQAHNVIGEIKKLLVTIRAPDEMEIDLRAGSRSADDAAALSQLLQIGLLYEGYQSSQSNPELAAILQGTSIASNGNDVELSLFVTDDQAVSLIEHNTFTSLM